MVNGPAKFTKAMKVDMWAYFVNTNKEWGFFFLRKNEFYILILMELIWQRKMENYGLKRDLMGILKFRDRKGSI